LSSAFKASNIRARAILPYGTGRTVSFLYQNPHAGRRLLQPPLHPGRL